MNTREQAVVSRLRSGYTIATHASVINKDLSTEWDCKETEIIRLQLHTHHQSEIWKGGKEEMEKLLLFLKEIGLCNGI
jgi:hypothetical protein